MVPVCVASMPSARTYASNVLAAAWNCSALALPSFRSSMRPSQPRASVPKSASAYSSRSVNAPPSQSATRYRLTPSPSSDSPWYSYFSSMVPVPPARPVSSACATATPAPSATARAQAAAHTNATIIATA